MTGATPRIWVLLGGRRGDNNQVLALAEALGLPFETRTLEYKKRWHAYLRFFPSKPYLLTKEARRTLAPPWPDVVIGVGRRSVAVCRWIRKASGMCTKIVRVGNPRADNRLFDLVITTAQYPVPRDENVVVLPVSMGRHRQAPVPAEQEASRLAMLPRPHLLVSLGGKTRYWQLPEDRLISAIRQLADRAAATGGTLIVVTSPRTSDSSVEAIRCSGAPCHIIADGSVRYPVLLADADEHFVTADSASMISEAVLTGKPVGLIPVELDDEGVDELGENGYSTEKRDLRRFWAELQSRDLVGTIENPSRGDVNDPVEQAATAVKKLLGDLVQ